MIDYIYSLLVITTTSQILLDIMLGQHKDHSMPPSDFNLGVDVAFANTNVMLAAATFGKLFAPPSSAPTKTT